MAHLPLDSYYIVSKVDNKFVNLCNTDPPLLREPLVVGNKQLLFRIEPVGDPRNNIYTIWTEGYYRHLRGDNIHVFGSLDKGEPQKWRITYQSSVNAYNIESLDGKAWSDPGGYPNCERKLYLEPLWNPTSPQQTFRIQPLVD